jgi:phosphohistidine phosphatase
MGGVTRRLAVLRHAKSDWSRPEPDVERPLAARGRRDATAAGGWLRAELPDIDLVLCSPAVRARQTWQRAAAGLPDPPPVRIEPRIYAATADALLAVARDLPPSATTVVLVGHHPGLADLVALLTGTELVLKTCAVAVPEFTGGWPDLGPGRATLRVTAKIRGTG